MSTPRRILSFVFLCIPTFFISFDAAAREGNGEGNDASSSSAGSIDPKSGPTPPAVASRIGQRVADFRLPNCYGKEVALSDFADQRAVVLVFLGTECPLAKLYAPRLAKLQTRFGESVQILGINSNTQDSLTEVAAYTRRFGVNFPMLKDVGNRVADAVGARRTPEVFLLDRGRHVRYHGRIDDQYGVGYVRPRPATEDLAIAIDQVIGGKAVTRPVTPLAGCHIGRARPRRHAGEVTYTKDVAAIFNTHCVSCHRAGEIAPFPLAEYDDVIGWEDTIREVIDDQRMPPWPADPKHGRFANDARLSSTERDRIFAWIDGGMPEGDPSDLPPQPSFTDGWQIDTPHQVIRMRPEPFAVPAEGVIDYQRFIVDPKWTEDRYIVQAEARPDQRSVVHHILLYIIPPGERRPDLRQVLVAYAPGTPPLRLDPGVAMKVEAGSKILFEMHYTPNGTAVEDLSYAGMRFAKSEDVDQQMQGQIAINTRFRIPPYEPDHTVVAEYRVRRDERLLSMTPHMHLRGKSFRYEAWFPDGQREVLLNVPRYDFNWQLRYILQEPMRLPRGTRIRCTAVFDNSDTNPTNPDPDRTVTWGDQSFDEMMIGFMTTLPE